MRFVQINDNTKTAIHRPWIDVDSIVFVKPVDVPTLPDPGKQGPQTGSITNRGCKVGFVGGLVLDFHTARATRQIISLINPDKVVDTDIPNADRGVTRAMIKCPICGETHGYQPEGPSIGHFRDAHAREMAYRKVIGAIRRLGADAGDETCCGADYETISIVSGMNPALVHKSIFEGTRRGILIDLGGIIYFEDSLDLHDSLSNFGYRDDEAEWDELGPEMGDEDNRDWDETTPFPVLASDHENDTPDPTPELSRFYVRAESKFGSR